MSADCDTVGGVINHLDNAVLKVLSVTMDVTLTSIVVITV